MLPSPGRGNDGGYDGYPDASDLLVRFQEDHCFLSGAFHSYYPER